jgi:hypothetical protein
MRRTYRKRTGRKRKTMKTLKIRGGNFDDPDTKDFVNSKIEALEQKISEMESNMPVYLGYSVCFGMIFIPKDADLNFFYLHIMRSIKCAIDSIKGSNHHYKDYTFISLQKLASLPNLKMPVRKNEVDRMMNSYLNFTPLEEDDRILIDNHRYEALMEKYPGLFYLTD